MAAAAADEKDGGILVAELVGELGDEVRVDVHRWKHLPRLQNGTTADGGEIGQADEHPLGTRAHVDQLSLLVFGEELPSLGRLHITGI